MTRTRCIRHLGCPAGTDQDSKLYIPQAESCRKRLSTRWRRQARQEDETVESWRDDCSEISEASVVMSSNNFGRNNP
jgi:hypothetical protein